MYLFANFAASTPYGSLFSFVPCLAVLGARIPARTKVTLAFSFGMRSLNRDPAATNSTTAACRPARFHEGKYWVARLPFSEASTIRGRETSLGECRPRVSVTALFALQLHRPGRAKLGDGLPLFGNYQLVELQRAILVVPLVAQDGGETLLDKLLGDVSVLSIIRKATDQDIRARRRLLTCLGYRI